ncbi:MAG: hypothetical protein LBU32_10400 [Clostridiales bacterium]|nr:hypothetical protein [Clostridiales bacterium]
MARLEDITVGASVVGIAGSAPVSVVAVVSRIGRLLPARKQGGAARW